MNLIRGVVKYNDHRSKYSEGGYLMISIAVDERISRSIDIRYDAFGFAAGVPAFCRGVTHGVLALPIPQIPAHVVERQFRFPSQRR